MNRHHAIFGCALIGSALSGSALIASLLPTPIMGQPQNVCLQRKDIVSWKALDENTIVFSDRNGGNYTLTFVDDCPTGTRNPSVIIQSMKPSGCITQGDHIDVRAGGPIPPPVCVIGSVHAGARTGPAPVAGAAGGLSKRNP